MLAISCLPFYHDIAFLFLYRDFTTAKLYKARIQNFEFLFEFSAFSFEFLQENIVSWFLGILVFIGSSLLEILYCFDLTLLL